MSCSRVCFLEGGGLGAEHVHVDVEDVSVRGAADTGDMGCEFVEEADDPVSLVIVCY